MCPNSNRGGVRIALAVSHDEAGRRRELMLADALRSRSYSTEVADWQDPGVRWSDFDVVVIRSTWTYYKNSVGFLSWLDQVSAHAQLINDKSLICWNIHKRYLCELAGAGIPVVPTVVKTRGEAETVPQLLAAQDWPEGVIKPAIDVGGMGARRVSLSCASAAAYAERLLDVMDVIVQPYVDSITELGENLLIFVGGSYSHTVRRRPAPGGFLTHEVHGGSVELVDPTPEQLRLATHVYESLPGRPIIARIDMVEMHGTPVIQEVEVIDPCLYPELNPSVTDALSAAITSALEHGKEADPVVRLGLHPAHAAGSGVPRRLAKTRQTRKPVLRGTRASFPGDARQAAGIPTRRPPTTAAQARRQSLRGRREPLRSSWRCALPAGPAGAGRSWPGSPIPARTWRTGGRAR
jgi:glutathione synthase/RimK-type ligase-like ATP-grasp enzyme